MSIWLRSDQHPPTARPQPERHKKLPVRPPSRQIRRTARHSKRPGPHKRPRRMIGSPLRKRKNRNQRACRRKPQHRFNRRPRLLPNGASPALPHPRRLKRKLRPKGSCRSHHLGTRRRASLRPGLHQLPALPRTRRPPLRRPKRRRPSSNRCNPPCRNWRNLQNPRAHQNRSQKQFRHPHLPSLSQPTNLSRLQSPLGHLPGKNRFPKPGLSAKSRLWKKLRRKKKNPRPSCHPQLRPNPALRRCLWS